MLNKSKKNVHGVVNLNNARPSLNKNQRPSVKKIQTIDPNIENIRAARENNQVNTSKNKKNKTNRSTTNKKQTNVLNPINQTMHSSQKKGFLPRNENGQLLISRRHLIFGAIGAGAIIAGGSAIKFGIDEISSNSNYVNTLNVSKNKVINSDSLTQIDAEIFKIDDEFHMPYGTLAWANSSNYIACLVPTDKAKPLCVVDLINIKHGKKSNLIDKSIGQKDGFEIYDVRVCDAGVIWTEVNILQEEWKIYCSTLDSENNVNAMLVDSGNAEWETPTICVSNNFAYWQILPKASGEKNKLYSHVKKIGFNGLNISDSSFCIHSNSNSDIKNNPVVVYTSNGRMNSPIYGYKDGIIISPRAEAASIFYQLTYLDSNNNVKDSLCLPQNMKPVEVGYGDTGFNFAFDAIYNYGEGISNLGTYTPMIMQKNNYSEGSWLNFSRNPSCAPAWSNGYFIVRSTMSICAIDLTTQTYQILERPNASDDYGDYLATSGDSENIVTYANVYDQPIAGDEQKYTLLRIWKKA